MLQGCCVCFSGGIPAADSNEKSSEVQIQYGENDFKTDPIVKNDSSANNGGSVIKEREALSSTQMPKPHPPLHAVPSCPALTSSYEQRSARPASALSTSNKAGNDSTREVSIAAEDATRASHSRETSLRRNLSAGKGRAESATPSRGGKLVTKSYSFKRIMSFRTGGGNNRRSGNSVEFVQGNLTAGGGAANGSARPMQFGFLGQIYRRTSLTGSKFLRRVSSSRTGGFTGDCEGEDDEEDLANGDPSEEEKQQ